MEEPVTIIDRDVLKVLSVDTRMDILKVLSEGARTPSFISQKLNKNDATIVEHLDVLVKAGLVKKVERPGKKWVFYTLTERGQGIVSSKSRRLIIILSTSVLALLTGAFTYLRFYVQSFESLQKAALPLAENKSLETGIRIVAQYQSVYIYISLILIALGTFGILFYFIEKSKTKGVGI